MYIVCGRGMKLKYQPDPVWRFDFSARKWEEMHTTGSVPKGRSALEAALVLHPLHGCPVIYLFGGWNMRKYFRHMYKLRLDTLEWSKIRQYGPHEPTPRLCHTLTASPDNERLYLFGGEEFSGKFKNDLHVYHVREERWERVATHGTPPAERHGHRAEIFHNALYVYGGFDGSRFFADMHRLDLATLTWSELRAVCGGIVPPGLTCHSMAGFEVDASASADTHHPDPDCGALLLLLLVVLCTGRA